jgi:hypothetical protein
MAKAVSKSMKAVRGGGGKMFGKSGASARKSGTTSPDAGGASKSPLKGGKGKMFGFSGSKPSKAC